MLPTPTLLPPAEHHVLDDWDEPGDLPAGVTLGASPSASAVPVPVAMSGPELDGRAVQEGGEGQGRAERR